MTKAEINATTEVEDVTLDVDAQYAIALSAWEDEGGQA